MMRDPSDDELTLREKLAVRQVLKTTPSDLLINWCTLMLPCGLFIGIGFFVDSAVMVSCGALAIILIILASIPKEMRQHRNLQSALKKLGAKADDPDTAHTDSGKKD